MSIRAARRYSIKCIEIVESFCTQKAKKVCEKTVTYAIMAKGMECLCFAMPFFKIR